MFEPFPKLTRFSHGWVVTEKIDGSNAQVLIVPEAEWDQDDSTLTYPADALACVDGHAIMAGSRNRWLGLGSADHHGFAQFVEKNAADFVRLLGPGRHFGEWFGSGIGKRNYNLEKGEKRLALFNASRWTGQELPEGVVVVPTLFQGRLEHSETFDNVLNDLKQNGSALAPGFMNPEGIVMFHGPSGTAFKKTFDYDEAGKWAENQERKQA